MLTQERQMIIRDRLAQDGKVIATQLAIEFQVSEDTVRRDLRELAGQGLCQRVYGGAITPVPDVAPIQLRQSEDSPEKRAVAEMAAKTVRSGQVIFIDAGSTNLLIAQALPQDMDLTIATNAPLIANALSGHPRVEVLLLGGRIDHRRGAALGATTLKAIAEIHADLFFVGTCALDPQSGLTTFDAAEAEIKRAFLAQSDRLCVVATAGKLGTRAPFRISGAERVDALITSTAADADLLAMFKALGVQTSLAR